MLPRVLVLVAATVASHAEAEPAPIRVVLADPDPELRRALESTLSPWQLEIVVAPAVPSSVSEAEQQAGNHDARFVVWRRDGDLVVFDRTRGAAEHRDGRRGTLDGPGAASAALTVKTLMRLPPPGEPIASTPAPPVPAPVPVPVAPPRRELRVHAGLASRYLRGSEATFGARFEGAVFVRPSTASGLRLGLGAELGTAADVANMGFKGTWSDSSLVAFVSWGFDRGRWQLEPHVGLGVTRSKLTGTEMSSPRSESATLAVLHGGVWVRCRFGGFSIGAGLDGVGTPGTPTYTRASSAVEIFRVPGLGVALGLVTAFDLSL